MPGNNNPWAGELASRRKKNSVTGRQTSEGKSPKYASPPPASQQLEGKDIREALTSPQPPTERTLGRISPAPLISCGEPKSPLIPLDKAVPTNPEPTVTSAETEDSFTPSNPCCTPKQNSGKVKPEDNEATKRQEVLNTKRQEVPNTNKQEVPNTKRQEVLNTKRQEEPNTNKRQEVMQGGKAAQSEQKKPVKEEREAVQVSQERKREKNPSKGETIVEREVNGEEVKPSKKEGDWLKESRKNLKPVVQLFKAAESANPEVESPIEQLISNKGMEESNKGEQLEEWS